MSSVHSCYLFLISSASVRSLTFVSFIVPLVTPIFLSNLYCLQFYYFPLILAVFIYEDFLIFPCYSPELCIPLCISFLFSFAFDFSYFPSCFKASSGNPFFKSHLFFLGMVLMITSCTMLQTSPSIVLQATRPNPLNLFFISTINS